MQKNQTTIQRSVHFTGKGLHSGRIVKLEVLPAPASSGIVFQRTDHAEAQTVKAIASQISSTTLSTTIGSGISSVSTIEHLMAAFSGLGISNALVKLDSPEVPILDGSSMTFVRELLNAGMLDLGKPQKYLSCVRPFEVRNGDQFIKIEPDDNFSIKCSIDFSHKLIGQQYINYSSSLENFIGISNSRTFCHIRDVNAMREQGLALGGSLENAIVLSDDGVMNEGGLHSNNEFVQHKLLDLIGDVALLGSPLIGRITAHKPGHSLHAEFTKALSENEDKYLEEVFFTEKLSGSERAKRTIFAPMWANLG